MNMHINSGHPRFRGAVPINRNQRRGSVLVLAAVFVIVILAITALSIDLGYISVTKAQMRNAADGAALAAAIELTDGLGIAPAKSTSAVVSSANAAAKTVAGLQRNGDQASTLLNTGRDLRYGQLSWNSTKSKWDKSWGTTPYNLVETTIHRDQAQSEGTPRADGRLPLFFATAVGHRDTAMTATAEAALYPGVGVKLTANSTQTAGILPITLDDSTWTALMAGAGTDNFHYDPSTGVVSPGSDGIKEVSLYPTGTGSPGNRGTVNIGTTNNSTANLQRQIEFGLNAADLAPYGGQLRTDSGPITLPGNPGISAAIKSSLNTVIGKPRLIPIFTALTGNGANAKYTISKFVGVRVLYVQLTGGSKTVVIQPATYSAQSVIPGKISVTDETYWTKPRLAQ